MRLIIISTPEPIQHEGDLIARLLSLDLFALHLRKPHSTEDEMRRLIDSIPSEYHSRIVLHDHFALAAAYGLKGVHLNRRNPVAPTGPSRQPVVLHTLLGRTGSRTATG